MNNIYFAVDPGLTTGVARYSPRHFDCHCTEGVAYQNTEPQVIIQWIINDIDLMSIYHGDLKFHFTVEAFNGGGYRDKEAIQTLELVGFFYHTFAGTWDYGYNHVRKVGSSMRMSGRREAERILGPVESPPHRWDALMHAIVHSREDDASD